ncbi:unnamed protein product [Tuber melanosporum]|uniref:(Perigord truffle) hypothetical protein n=1 Tax=Tuber melanosporum (strain Mel28) TaxID=656061 RepID=D5GDZ6_TUBMM|nr:uncharacterized protein GSTUM_00001151001 [Tuber melanosporum]CAZ82739.1 unnamed protein product [Tuber melanosporum]
MEGDPPSLPPQMFTTSAQLLDLTDKKLLVALRDGRKLIGVLRSWDQQTLSCRVPSSAYTSGMRTNVLLLGEIDLDREDDIPFRRASVEEVFAAQRAIDTEKKRTDKVHRKKLRALGFEDEGEVLV